MDSLVLEKFLRALNDERAKAYERYCYAEPGAAPSYFMAYSAISAVQEALEFALKNAADGS